MENNHYRNPKNDNGVIKHHIDLINRSLMKIEGVEHVGSFDEEEITLVTNMGLLILKGEGLHITQLNLEIGQLAVEGFVNSINYEENKGNKKFRDKGKGLLDRILR